VSSNGFHGRLERLEDEQGWEDVLREVDRLATLYDVPFEEVLAETEQIIERFGHLSREETVRCVAEELGVPFDEFMRGVREAAAGGPWDYLWD
jgi:hypothetical protein